MDIINKKKGVKIIAKSSQDVSQPTNILNINNESLIVPNKIIANSLECNQPIPSISDINNLNVFTSFEFTEINRYLYPDLTHRTTSSVTNQTNNIINYINNNNTITKDISFNDNTVNKIKLPYISNSNYNVNNQNNQNSIRLTLINEIPQTIKKIYQNCSPFINPLICDNSLCKIVSASNWIDNINTTTAGYSSGLPSSYTLINYDASYSSGMDSTFKSASPLWGPSVLNQGQMGSCYSFASAEVITFSYIKYLIESNKNELIKSQLYNQQNNNLIVDNSNNYITKFGNSKIYSTDISNNIIISNNASSNILINLANYMLPCLSYIEQLFQNSYSLLDMKSNIFNQEGIVSSGMYCYLSSKSCPLELQYTYPLLNVIENDFLINKVNINNLNQNTREYIVEEWIRKRIHDIPNYVLDSANVYGYYKYNPLTLKKIDFKLLSVCNTSMLKNNYSNYDTLEHGNDTSNIIINNIKTLICNNYAVSFTLYCDKNHTIYNNGFPIPSFIEGGHSVMIVGYDDNYRYTDPYNKTNTGCFIIQNSWGQKLGVNGYFVLPYGHVNVSVLFSGIFSNAAANNWYGIQFYETY